MGYSKELLCNNYHLIRIGSNHSKYGDEYEVSFVLEQKNKSAHIKGASGKVKDLKQILEWAAEEGYDTVCWERLKEGRVKEVCVRLPKNNS